jgi:hypothetical protein
MSINTSEILSQGLSLLTYNGNNIVTPRDNHLNIFMGIGLWSVRDGLSEGLPIDIMQMLLSATIMRSQILEANLGKISKVIILIADSMAIRAGADKEKVLQLVQIYKRSLEPLLDLLNIKEPSEIILSSELESCSHYQEALESVENSRIAKQLKVEDEDHYAYIRTQTAITRYMNTHGHVGIKVGWICAESSKQLNGRVSAQYLKHWDELKFDGWFEEICKGSTMQYLYAKAGLKQSGKEKSISVSEGCPYTAYSKDQRYIVRTQDKKDIKTTCPIQKKVAAHWKGVAEVCSSLIQARLVHCMLLPEDCIKKSNAVATVYNMLNHWANPPVLSPKIVCEELVSPLLSDFLSNYDPTIEDSYRPSIMPEMAVVGSTDKPRSRPKCVLH